MHHTTNHQFASDVAFSPAVKQIQESKGSRAAYARMESQGGWSSQVSRELEGFISGLDMFYFGTANKLGQPYIQYRGGPKGLLKVIDQQTLGFADFAGNRQYISIGNLSENPKAFLFLMDYVNAYRVKIWGTATVVEDDQKLIGSLMDESYKGVPERAILFHIDACGSPACSTFSTVLEVQHQGAGTPPFFAS